MKEECCRFTYAAPEPYPPLEVEEKNRRYGVALLDNVGGMISEMSAISLYVYNHLVMAGQPEVAECFLRISMVEMRHLNIFGTLAHQLGMDPRLWSLRRGQPTWWTPAYNQYPRSLRALLCNALQEERSAIAKYKKQLQWIQDPGIQANLRRILLDEALHIEIFTQLLKSYGGER